MELDAETLPDDPAMLRAMLLAERTLRIEAERRAEQLEGFLAALRRNRFGARSERLDPDQLNLGLEEIEQEIGAASAAAERLAGSPARRQPRARNLGHLPDHLPRIERIVDIPDKHCPCCRGDLHPIGEDVAERLDVVPAQFRVLVTRRPKYACRSCQGTAVQAPAPGHVVEGGLPTEALVAQVVVGKYADHCPLYRQAGIYARQGIDLDRATLADWVGRAAWFLEPLYASLRAELMASAKLFADETTAPVLDPGRGRTKTGQFWAYARDDRPWGGPAPPAVAYVYAPDRSKARPQEHLRGFRGVLQVDGYAGYKALAETGAVELAFCWAHARRRFYEIAAAGPAPIAEEALRRIAALYAIEADLRGQTAERRCAERQARSKPLVEAFERWLRERLDAVSGKSPTAAAIRYALFAGSDGGAQHWACLASLIETCKLNAVDPLAYLTDILARLAQGHPVNRVDELLPWRWARSASPTV